MMHVQPTRGVFDCHDLRVLQRAYEAGLQSIKAEGLTSEEDRRDLAKLLMCLAADLVSAGHGIKGADAEVFLAREASRIMIDLNVMPQCA